jgi:ectoine hydroxylase-related dioxygenase (phytanoyl-CoA dioxygenase family)
MLTDEQVASFHRDGFVKGDRVLNDAEIEELMAEVMRVIDDRDRPDLPQPVATRNFGKADTPVWQIVNIWQASPPFEKLMRSPEVARDAALLTGAKELRVWHDQIQYKPPEKGGVNMWHQDATAWRTLQPKTAQVTAWIALDDADEDNGAMSMVPGSQRWGPQWEFLHTLSDFDGLPDTFEGNPVETRLCPVERGVVHFHHCLTWHGSHGNLSGRHRRALAIHFMTEETVYDATGEHPMKPFIEVADGEKVAGGPFHLVWSAAESQPA